MRKQSPGMRSNIKLATAFWGKLTYRTIEGLEELTERYCLSIATGDLTYLDGRWYVSHAGLLRLACRKNCLGIRVHPVLQFCDPVAGRWAFKATVYKSRQCKGFVGYGDADPSNVSPLVRGAEMRVAETRAVNRALRKAYGIGICSIEELGSFSGPLIRASELRKASGSTREPSTNRNGHHPLRDRLCLLIRQHQLDPALVKAYAADYCEVAELRLATRQQVATFIKHLADYAQSDRKGLLCQLNSYAPKPAGPAVIDRSDTEAHEKAPGAA